VFVLNLKFPTKGTRRIRLVGPEYITGLIVNAGDTLHRPARRRRLFVSSDSFYVSVQPSGLNQATSLRTLTGLTVINGAIGGTGYVKPTPYGDSTRLARLAAEDPANLVGVIVNGGANDLTGPTVAQVTAAQTALYTAIRNLVPDAPIVVVGMEDSQYFRANYGAAVDTLGAAIKATALAHPAVVKFVDMLAEDWFQGTGYAGAPNGTGNTNRLIGPDAVHLTDAGVDYAAALTAEHLRVTPATAGAAA
jgi:lysophospholipase L1-like esterase